MKWSAEWSPDACILWSRKTLSIFQKHSKTDSLLGCNRKYHPKGPYILFTILYIWTNSTESFKRCVPSNCGNISDLWPHNSPSPVFFLQAFLTDLRKMCGNALFVRPVIIICDGCIVPIQAISWTFCWINLEDLLQRYYDIITGQHSIRKLTSSFYMDVLATQWKMIKRLARKF